MSPINREFTASFQKTNTSLILILDGLYAQMLQINLIGSFVWLVVEVHGTENPPTRRPLINTWFWQETAINNHAKDRLGRMKSTNNQLEDGRTPKGTQVRTNPSLFPLTGSE